MAITLRYFTVFGIPAFKHITTSARIELTDHLYRKHCDRQKQA